MRVLFVTDLHGSTPVFEKSISAADEFDVDLLVVGGDLSGKHVVPVIPGNDGTFKVFEPRKHIAQKQGIETELEEMQVSKAEWDMYSRALETKGYYWHTGTEEEILRLYGENEQKQLFDICEEEIYSRLRKWAGLVNKLLPDDVKCIWTGGNDDSKSLLDKLTHSDLGRFEYAEHVVKKIMSYEILSLGYSNETPFHTSRELPDGQIFQRLMELMPAVSDPSRLILNVHVPPSDCGRLDMCLDFRNPKKYIHVGSPDVRQFIEKVQPLADMAGHVHEGKGHSVIGRTHIFNPGSEFQAGVLNAYVIEFLDDRVRDYLHFVR